jgi:acetoin utilization protein AcuB
VPEPVAIKSWMSGDPLSVRAADPALAALDLMIERGIRHLPVLDASRRVVGVLSLDDLRAALPFEVSLRRAPDPIARQLARDWCVGDVMTYAPHTLAEDAPLAEAAARMAEHRIGCIPVVDAQGRLVGILSETDVLQALATSLWSDRVRERRGAQADLEDLVAALRRERAAIAQSLDRYHAEERALAAGSRDVPTDLAERGAEATDLARIETLDALAARRLAALDRALDHAAQGRLGVCDDCGGAIPPGRLRAVPGTTRCVACARAAEAPA